MLEKYNYQIKKIIKLMVMLFATYCILRYTLVDISKMDIAKIVFLIGIIFIILDNYYPVIDYE